MKKELCTIIQRIKKGISGGKGKKLQTIHVDQMPNYISKNLDKYKTWLDFDY